MTAGGRSGVTWRAAVAAFIFLFPTWLSTSASPYVETPYFADAVSDGALPPIGERLPAAPAVVAFDGERMRPGLQGGDLRLLMAKQKDVRMMMVYGYARLVGYNANLEIVPDILERVEVEDGRKFTLYLRKGHKWSDGTPFTTEAFRYYWEDVANNADLSPLGPPKRLLVDGEPPLFEIIDETTVRYSWSKPNPFFLPELAGAQPLFIYRPGHYLKQFHAKYRDEAELAALVKEASARNWAALHHRKDHQYRSDNPDLPTLQPWVNTTPPPSERFVFERNPYYHWIDSDGRQLPYIDRLIVNIASSKLIPAKTGFGESDLQARYIRFDNYTFLKEGEANQNFKVRLWRTAKGSQMALYPNLNAADPVWRDLLRDVRFRRALSLAIDRHEINQVIYFGLAREGGNTVLAESPLFKPEYQQAWSRFDINRANALLDEIGLTERDSRGVRLLPDGRPLDIIVDTAGESTEETDVLELVLDNWAKIGVKLYTKPSQREVFRNRVFSGESIMSVWAGLENGLPTADMSPYELAPTSQQQLQWPKWGQYFETGGQAGVKTNLPIAQDLARLNQAWRAASTSAERKQIWQRMLKIHSDQVFTIGIVSGVLQPLVVNNELQNVPEDGIYNWDPGAYFGMYRPDTFWFTESRRKPTQ